MLIRLQPKIIHACDLDTVIPSFIYSKLFGKTIVFDMFDRYAMLNIPPKHKILFRTVNALEEYFCHHSFLLITIGDWILETFKNKPKNYMIITNYSEDIFLPKINSSDEKFSLVYTGPVRRNRALLEISEIVKGLDNVQFVIAGRLMHNEIFTKIVNNPHVLYKGVVSPEEAISIMMNGNISIALYELDNPEKIFSDSTLVFVQGGMILYDLQQKEEVFANPQKLFESMMCGIPVITNVATNVIKDTNCGIIVDYNNIPQIKKSILDLKANPEKRKRLGENGRKAFLTEYNWKNMENRLINFYDNLLKKNQV